MASGALLICSLAVNGPTGARVQRPPLSLASVILGTTPGLIPFVSERGSEPSALRGIGPSGTLLRENGPARDDREVGR